MFIDACFRIYKKIRVSYFYIFYLISQVNYLTGEQTSKYSDVTEEVQVVRTRRPRKKTAQIKAMFCNESNLHLHQEFKKEQT